MKIQRKGQAVKDTLVRIEAELKERGVTSVHFSFNPHANLTTEKIAQDMIAVLQAYLDGKCTRIEKLDRPA